MAGKLWRWLIVVVLVWQLIRIVVGALSAPWTWTLDQCLLVFLALCLPVGLVTWGRIWKLGGIEAVKGRWLETWRIMDTQSHTKSTFRRWFWFWVVVLLVIVAFQSFMGPHV